MPEGAKTVTVTVATLQEADTTVGNTLTVVPNPIDVSIEMGALLGSEMGSVIVVRGSEVMKLEAGSELKEKTVVSTDGWAMVVK